MKTLNLIELCNQYMNTENTLFITKRIVSLLEEKENKHRVFPDIEKKYTKSVTLEIFYNVKLKLESTEAYSNIEWISYCVEWMSILQAEYHTGTKNHPFKGEFWTPAK